MKKIIPFCTTTLLLFGCFEKDTQYYLKNIEKAHEKVAECDAKTEEAHWDRDEKKLDEVRNNPACKAAQEAIREHENQQIINQNKDAYEKAMQELQEKYGQLDWVAFTTVFQNVYQGFLERELQKTDSGEIDWLRSYDINAQVWSDLYRQKVKPAKQEMARLPTDQLRAQEEKYCSTDKRPYSACQVWTEALTESFQKKYENIHLSKIIEQYKNECRLVEYSNRDEVTCNNLNKVIDKQSETALNNFTIPELEQTYSQACVNRDEISHSLCSNIKKVSNEKGLALVEQYVSEAALLKQEYNNCVGRIQPLMQAYENLDYFKGGAEKKREAEQIASSYPCAHVKVARNRLHLDTDFTKAMP